MVRTQHLTIQCCQLLRINAAEIWIKKEEDVHLETWREIPACQTLPQAATVPAPSLMAPARIRMRRKNFTDGVITNTGLSPHGSKQCVVPGMYTT